MGCDGDDIGSTATSPRRIRMMKPRRDPMHSRIFAVSQKIHYTVDWVIQWEVRTTNMVQSRPDQRNGKYEMFMFQ